MDSMLPYGVLLTNSETGSREAYREPGYLPTGYREAYITECTSGYTSQVVYTRVYLRVSLMVVYTRVYLRVSPMVGIPQCVYLRVSPWWVYLSVYLSVYRRVFLGVLHTRVYLRVLHTRVYLRESGTVAQSGLLPLFPFHCWSRVPAQAIPVSLLVDNSCPGYSRLLFPFHCW